jgi:hypothetical protein
MQTQLLLYLNVQRFASWGRILGGGGYWVFIVTLDWHNNCTYSQGTKWYFRYTLCSGEVRVIIIYISANTYHFLVVRTFTAHSSGCVAIHNAQSLTIFTIYWAMSMSHTTSSHPWTRLSPFPQASGNHHSILNFSKINLLDSTYKWDHVVYVSLCMAYFTLHNVLQVHPCFHKWHNFIFFIA